MEVTKVSENLIRIRADEGKVFAMKETGDILGFTMAANPNADFSLFIEIDIPKEPEEEVE